MVRRLEMQKRVPDSKGVRARATQRHCFVNDWDMCHRTKPCAGQTARMVQKTKCEHYPNDRLCDRCKAADLFS